MKKINFILLDIEEYDEILTHLKTALEIDQYKEENRMKDAHLRMGISILEKEEEEND